MTEEQQIWKGTPSHLTKIFHYLISIILVVVAVPIFYQLVGSPLCYVLAAIPLCYAFYIWLNIKTTTYELTTERLRTSMGVLNKEVDELELYRVKDYKIESPFWLRICSLSNIILMTSDQTTPIITLSAIGDAQNLLNQIRSRVEACRQKRGVHEVDMA